MCSTEILFLNMDCVFIFNHRLTTKLYSDAFKGLYSVNGQ